MSDPPRSCVLIATFTFVEAILKSAWRDVRVAIQMVVYPYRMPSMLIITLPNTFLQERELIRLSIMSLIMYSIEVSYAT